MTWVNKKQKKRNNKSYIQTFTNFCITVLHIIFNDNNFTGMNLNLLKIHFMQDLD